MKERVKNLFFVILVLDICLVSYYFLCKKFPYITIKCLFFEITKLKCPGCGITRMLFNFLEFKFVEGVSFNCFLALTSPVVLCILIYCGYAYIYDKEKGKIFNGVCLGYLVLLIIWGIVRNCVGL